MTLAAVYRECGHVMAPDTGPLHLAAAAGARTVSVFRATAGERNAPAGAAHRFLQAPMECAACLRRRATATGNAGRACARTTPRR
jgi:ADP-heptose:LPS heptosyltransferase